MEGTLLYSQSPGESAEVQQLKRQLAKLHLDSNNKSDNASYYSLLQPDSLPIVTISHQSTEEEAEKMKQIDAIGRVRPAKNSPQSKHGHFCSGERCKDYKCSSFYLDENDDDDEKIFSDVFTTKSSPDSSQYDQDDPFNVCLPLLFLQIVVSNFVLSLGTVDFSN